MRRRFLFFTIVLFAFLIAISGCDEGDDGNPAGDTNDPAPGTEQDFELGDMGVMITMVWIPAGTFGMGSPDTEQDRYSDEGPVHTVTIIQGYWMGRCEVTQAQWETVVGAWDFYFDGNPTHPAEQVSHNDITNDFLPDINATETGDPWRLPTEAEWEYAARAGTSTRYYWGDDPNYSEIGNYAWHHGNSSGTTHPIGQKLPNGWGLYDMSGNVSEWCSDWYGDYSSDSVTDPTGPTTGSYRVFRGGCLGNSVMYCRSAYRPYFPPAYRSISCGFRLVREEQ